MTMLASAVYKPGEWHDFFVMVGGAAAVLTGLVFVAPGPSTRAFCPSL